jgi:prepilin-type N-terminal cleavage/methylation domain-containing protein
MSGGNKPFGYTIIEVMIVLAISGFMFVIAMTFISGKQAKTSFYTGVYEMSDSINSVINQVKSGQYSDANFSCSNSGGAITISASPANKQGSNADCTFVGKYIKVVDGSTSYSIYSLAGKRQDAVVTDNNEYLASLSPTPIISTTGSPALDLTVTKNIPQTLSSAGGASFGFVQNSDSSGLLLVKAGSDPVAGSPLSLSILGKSVLCLTDGSRYASIIVGAAGNNVNATVKIQNDRVTCVEGS